MAELNSESPNTDVVSTNSVSFLFLLKKAGKFSLQCLIDKSMKTYLSRGQNGLPHPGIIFSCNKIDSRLKKGSVLPDLLHDFIYQHVENYSGS